MRWYALGIVLVVTAVYFQTADFEFIDYDDPDHVSANPIVSQGLSTRGIIWAFANASTGTWMPLTWISHMVDFSVFGLWSGGHHIVNVFLHGLSSVVLLVVLHRATGRVGRSAVVAMIFALHPLHVESVAWISERKDVLSGFWYLVTLLFYVGYTTRPSAARYGLVLGAFAFALMAKPMAVTLPLVLLLWDWWPLGRISTSPGQNPATLRPTVPLRTAVVEKVPLVAMACAVGIVTLTAQSGAGAMSDTDALPISVRLSNAVVSYAIYMVQTVWPIGLSVFYPLASVSIASLVASGLLLIAALAVTWRFANSRPYLLGGFAWFVITLLPVIGIIQVGLQAHADRYMYVPQIGLSIALVWALADIVERRATLRMPLLVIGTAVGIALSVLTWRQAGRWRDTTTLFQRALDVTADNFIANYALGVEARKNERHDEAERYYREALRIRPTYAEAHVALAEILIRRGQLQNAEEHLRAAVALSPRLPEARVNLGFVLHRTSRVPEAITEYRAAIDLRPAHGPTRMGLAFVLADSGDVAGATQLADEAVGLAPSDQQLRAAREQLALRLNPERTDSIGTAEAHLRRANAQISNGRYAEAIVELREAIRLGNRDARTYANLGAALASVGQFDEAIAAFDAALKINPDLVEVRANRERAIDLKGRGGRGGR